MNCLSIGICLAICLLSAYKCEASGVVEIYVAIDPKVISDYINHGSSPDGAEADARRDAEYFLEEVSNMLQSTGTSISIRVSRMDVLTEGVFSDCHLIDGDNIHEDFGLQLFRKYVKDQGLFDSLNCDMALLYTGYNIYGDSDATAGYAYVGSVCSENAVAMVEYDGTFRTVHVTAHEIGHVLGLNHDGDGCDDGYIMTETLGFSAQRWTFSPCSVSVLSGLIPDMACITTTNAASEVPDETQRDALLDVHEMCRRAMNYTSGYMCMSSNLYEGASPQGDIVCERIYCIKPDGFCYSAHTANGIVCGVDQRCSNGECVTAPDNLPVPAGREADCLYGDVTVLKLSGGLTTTCSEFFGQGSNRHQCYSYTIEAACCATCEALRSDIPGCPYGDRSSQCVAYPKSAVCPSYADTLCCEYCHGWSRKRSADGNQNTPTLNATNVDKATQEDPGKEKEGGVFKTSE